MGTTPEGKVKERVRDLLKAFDCYYEMPVPGGFGKSGLDFVVCKNGFFLEIETKAPGNTPTDRQNKTIRDIGNAGGAAIVVDGPEGLKLLHGWLELASRCSAGQVLNTVRETLLKQHGIDPKTGLVVDPELAGKVVNKPTH